MNLHFALQGCRSPTFVGFCLAPIRPPPWQAHSKAASRCWESALGRFGVERRVFPSTQAKPKAVPTTIPL